MGEVSLRPVKPLQVNPVALSQPLGATLAFLGVDRCMPLMHGAQGCTSFAKVYFTRHFCEPIAIQTTAVTDPLLDYLIAMQPPPEFDALEADRLAAMARMPEPQP